MGLLTSGLFVRAIFETAQILLYEEIGELKSDNLTSWNISWFLGLILFEIAPFLCMYIIFNVDGDVGKTMIAASTQF